MALVIKARGLLVQAGRRLLRVHAAHRGPVRLRIACGELLTALHPCPPAFPAPLPAPPQDTWYMWVSILLFLFFAGFWMSRYSKAMKLFPVLIIMPIIQVGGARPWGTLISMSFHGGWRVCTGARCRTVTEIRDEERSWLLDAPSTHTTARALLADCVGAVQHAVRHALLPGELLHLSRLSRLFCQLYAACFR